MRFSSGETEPTLQRKCVSSCGAGTHLLWSVGSGSPDESRINQEPKRADGQETCHDRVSKASPNSTSLDEQKSSNQEFGLHSPDHRRRRSPAAQPVRYDVHHLAYNSLLHR